MQPLRFNPLLKQTLWGGERIIPFKHLDSNLTQVGESWEISSVPGNETTVKGGPYDGKILSEVIAEEKEKLVGATCYKYFGKELPLLIKFIDAAQPLSIQVHPDDETARKQGHERGKNEMWYIMDDTPGASLMAGLKTQITPAEYEQMVANDTITDAISHYDVKEGDCFYLPAGRIHSIGKGCFLAEIQQTSDVTYRIYDFKRKDKNGNYRELHTRLAAESIDYHVQDNYRTQYVMTPDQGVSLVQCPYFHTFVYDLTKPMTIDLKDLDNFVILIVTRGEGTLTDNEGNTEQLRQGDTLLVPATTESLKVDGHVKFLFTYAD